MAALESHQYWTIATTVVIVPVLYVVYQLFLHPLARYPGPVIARLTSFWSLYHALKAQRHLALHELHQRYGPIVRYGPNHISINDSEALKQIYGAKANVQKSSYYTAGFGISLFNCIDRRVHARKRRVTIQAFSELAIRKMEPYVLSTLRDWCSAIGQTCKEDDDTSSKEKASARRLHWSLPRDMARWSSRLTFDTLGEIAFGKSFETITKPDQRPYLDVMNLNGRIVDIAGQVPWLGRWGLDHFLRSGTVADRKLQVGFPTQQLALRVAEKPEATDRRDILYFLMQARDPDTGTDTTATALSAVLYFLTRNPEVLAELTGEIRASFSDVESIVKGPTLDRLKLLHACINEALRLCPPVSGSLPREVLAGGQEVVGHEFPEGTVIGVSIYSLHHNAAYFDEPFRFRPSRWLSEVSAQGEDESDNPVATTLSRQRQAFIPFGFGPRICIAKKVALMELELGVARALFLYDVRTAPGEEDVGVGPRGEYSIRENFLVVDRKGPVVQFRRRENLIQTEP